ncbi:MAG: AAA family ATPase [Planctomycetota bacterium]
MSPRKKKSDAQPAYLLGLEWRDRDKEPPNKEKYPFQLPWLTEKFELEFKSPVTFFVGENGSGKSTLIEAMAVLTGLPITGGSRNEASARLGPETDSELAHELRPLFRKQPRDGYFFRAELFANFASLLDERNADPEFRRWGNPYSAYGGKSLHHRSHGESFMELINHRLNRGLYLLDEPESALSPQRQLFLLAKIRDRVRTGASQFVIATHSPILLTYPGAEIVSFDEPKLSKVALEETSHYFITKGILDNPQQYWKHLDQAGQKQLFDDQPE